MFGWILQKEKKREMEQMIKARSQIVASTRFITSLCTETARTKAFLSDTFTTVGDGAHCQFSHQAGEIDVFKGVAKISTVWTPYIAL